jgi:hypothetical protein
MKIWIKTIIAISLIILSLISWYYWNKDKQAKIDEVNKAKMAYTIKKWNIKTEVKVTATAKLANEQKLSFWQEWKITKVFIKVWDEVKAWQILAELNMDDYQNAIDSSKLELENAKLWLTKLLNNDTSLRESQIKAQIKEIKTNYEVEVEQEDILKTQLETSIKQKIDNLEQLKRDYLTDQKNIEIAKSWLNVSTNIETKQTESSLVSRKQTIDSIVNSLNSGLWDIEQIIESVDRIYGVSNEFKYENDSYENYLWAKDTNLKNKTEASILDWYNLINKYKTEFKKINTEITDTEIYSLVQNYYKDTSILIELCDNSLNSLDKSIESVWSLSKTMIDWFKVTINGSRNSTISIRKQLETFSSSINWLLSDKDQKDQLNVSIEQKNIDIEKKELSLKKLSEQINLLKIEIDNQKIDNTNQLNRKNTQNDTMLEKIDLLNKELKDLLDWADVYDIKQQQNQIKQAELKIERTTEQKDNYQIIADFWWRVRTIDIVEWEQYKLTDKKYIVVENPNLIELELQVSQIDIVKIKVKNTAIVTFDAYPNKAINSYISTINVNPEPNGRWWFYYKATIILNKQDLEILAWMTAIVNVLTAQAENVLIIPSLSILQNWEKKYVYKKEGEFYKKHEIKTWIVNNFQAEIKEWLKEWDIIKISAIDEELLKNMWIDESSNSIFWG